MDPNELLTDRYNPLIVGADNYNLSAGDSSWLDSSGVSDAFSLGGVGAWHSAINSFVNTGVTVANWFGADASYNDTYKELLDTNPEAAAYYSRHKEGVDLAGFIGGSLIPGTVGIKALRLLQGGEGIGVFGLGLMRAKQAGAIDEATALITKGVPSIDAQVKLLKYKSIAYGFADQTITAAAWETGVEATMGASPTLENQDWKSLVWNLGTGALIGGAIGGVFEAFGVRGTFKEIQKNTDELRREFESLTNLGKGAFNQGDRVVELVKSLDAIPLAPTAETAALAKETYNKATEKAKLILGELTPDRPELANALFDRMMYMKHELKMTADDFLERFAQAKVILPVTREDSSTQSIFYLRKQATAEWSDNILSPSDRRELLASGALKESELHPPLTLVNDQIGPKVLTNAHVPTAKDAYKAGADIFLDDELGLHLNPKAQNISKVNLPGTTNTAGTEGAPIIIDLRTGRGSSTAFPTVGDVFTAEELGADVRKYDRVGGYRYEVSSGEHSYLTPDYLEANGRFLWAARRGIQAGDVIPVSDLALFQQAVREASVSTDKKLLDAVKIQDSSGQLQTLTELRDSKGMLNLLETSKRNAFTDLANQVSEAGTKAGDNGLPVGLDLREIAHRINVPLEYLEQGLPKVQSLEQIAQDGTELAKPAYAKIIYDIGNPAIGKDGMVARGAAGVEGRIAIAKDLAQTVTANYFKQDAAKLIEIDPRLSQAKANSLQTGASALGASNADYATLEEMYEGIGAVIHNIKIAKMKGVGDTFVGSVSAIARAAPEVQAEMSLVTNILRASNENYVLIPNTQYMVLKKLVGQFDLRTFGETQANENNPLRVIFREGAENYLPKDSAGKPYILRIAGEQGEDILDKGKYAAYKLAPETHEFLSTSTALNDSRLVQHNNFLAAQGVPKSLDLGNVYAPPIDTKKYAYWALVREPLGNGASSSSVASITAVNASELAAKMAQAKTAGYEVFTKDQIARSHKVLGDYDYNMNMSENVVDSGLKRKGILSDLIPNISFEDTAREWVEWNQRQETRLLRNMTELKYAQPFAELSDLGDKYVELARSRIGNINKYLGSTAENPYDDYIKLALDLPKTAEYTLWHGAQEKVEAFFDSAFRVANKVFGAARDGQLSYEEANKVSQRYGMGTPFLTAADYLESQGMIAPKPYMRDYLQKVQGFMSAFTIRLDSMQALINTVSTPILQSHELSSAKKYFGTKEGIDNVNQLLSINLPSDAATRIPNSVKIQFNAVRALFADFRTEGMPLLTKYRDAGFDLSIIRQQGEAFNSLSFVGDESEKLLSQKFENAVKLGEKLTGNTAAESATRFVAANSAEQMLDALGIADGPIRLAMVRTFVNRVQGNYIASQRPVAFQGVIGQAMALFQTYQFNLMQQVFRSVENGDTKSLAILFGLQNTLYGLNGMPLFNAINTHIIGNAPGNPQHTDVSTAVPRMVGKDLGDFLMYGGASWATGAALYSRGDINPRQITVLPIDPRDWPAISGVTKLVGDIINTGKKLLNGADFTTSMLEGLEHNSISRPLAGLAQVAQGYSTTNKGDLIARTNEVSAVSNAARMLGAKPFNEAVALDALYRDDAYKAKDAARKELLGEAVKTAFIGGGSPSSDQINNFASEYASSGGRIQDFNKFLVNAMKNTSSSNVNRFVQKANNPLAQSMMTIMGGERLPDFTNIPETP